MRTLKRHGRYEHRRGGAGAQEQTPPTSFPQENGSCGGAKCCQHHRRVRLPEDARTRGPGRWAAGPGAAPGRSGGPAAMAEEPSSGRGGRAARPGHSPSAAPAAGRSAALSAAWAAGRAAGPAGSGPLGLARRRCPGNRGESGPRRPLRPPRGRLPLAAVPAWLRARPAAIALLCGEAVLAPTAAVSPSPAAPVLSSGPPALTESNL